MNRFLIVIMLAALGGQVPAANTAGATEVDLELVLAADVSRSMNATERQIQRDGYSAALSDPSFIKAVRTGMLGSIAVTYVEWAGEASQSVVVDWRVIDSESSALEFAREISDKPFDPARGTSISGAIDFGRQSIKANAFSGYRKVIDVSGDGPNNSGRPVLLARADAVSDGVTVNGLPILVPGAGVIDNLDDYYADCVIAGPGAFSLPARGIEEFAQAIRRKLILEVGARPMPEPHVLRANSTTDCLIGEKLRMRYFERYYPEL